MTSPRIAHPCAEEAALAVAAVTDRAGAVARELVELDEHRAAAELFSRIWSGTTGYRPLGPELITALSRTGNHVGGVYMGEVLVGACVGFFDANGGLHSHITGVAPECQGRHLGLVLKLQQRFWALARGVTVIRWTFDPLVRRNAHFNITRLGTRPVRYIPDFYGAMMDGVNVGERSDRFLVEWLLTDPVAVRAAAGTVWEPDVPELVAGGALRLLDENERGAPVPRTAESIGDRQLLVRVPADIAALRQADPLVAVRWRMEMRATMLRAQEAGLAVLGMSRNGWYVLGSGH